MILTSHTQFILKKAEDLAGFDRFIYEAITDCARKIKVSAPCLTFLS